MILSNEFYEVNKFVSATNHVIAMNAVQVSKRFWDKLSPAEQKLLQDAAIEAQNFQRVVSREAASKTLIVVWAFDPSVEDGMLSNRRVFVDHRARQERPDGACVDRDGGVWEAIFAGHRVDRYTPTGRLDRSIALPVTNPTCVRLGGPTYRTLFITTARKFLGAETLAREPLAGSVLAVDVDVAGLPEHRFVGPG